MCPQLPRLSLEYSHKAGLQTVITGMPLQIRPVTRGGHAGPVTMGRIARGPLSWTRPHCGMPSSPVFVWCRSGKGCPCLLCLSEQRLSSGDFERRVAFLPSLQHYPNHQNSQKGLMHFQLCATTLDEANPSVLWLQSHQSPTPM
jgi:hypothetical protein